MNRRPVSHLRILDFPVLNFWLGRQLSLRDTLDTDNGIRTEAVLGLDGRALTLVLA